MLNERQKQIFEITEAKQRVSVSFLAKKLYVSEMTVRRDLKKMETEGFIKRYHGGALVYDEYTSTSLDLRMRVNEKEKRTIATEAEKHIKDGQTIFIDNSSTCAYIIPCLKNYKDIKVITNSVKFLLMLSKMNIKCTLAGGEYDEVERCLLGRNTENFLRSINTDIAFLSCSGISDDGRVTESDEATAEITRIGLQNTKKAILLADNSKTGLTYTYTVCRVEDIDEVIVI